MHSSGGRFARCVGNVWGDLLCPSVGSASRLPVERGNDCQQSLVTCFLFPSHPIPPPSFLSSETPHGAQAYCFAFGLQAITLLRAHLTAPELHGILNVFAILTFIGVGAAYGLALYTLPLSAFDSLDRAVR